MLAAVCRQPGIIQHILPLHPLLFVRHVLLLQPLPSVQHILPLPSLPPAQPVQPVQPFSAGQPHPLRDAGQQIPAQGAAHRLDSQSRRQKQQIPPASISQHPFSCHAVNQHGRSVCRQQDAAMLKKGSHQGGRPLPDRYLVIAKPQKLLHQ